MDQLQYFIKHEDEKEGEKIIFYGIKALHLKLHLVLDNQKSQELCKSPHHSKNK